MQKVERSAIVSLIKNDKVRFAFVGSFAFVISSIILYILYDRVGLPIVVAQIISAEGGVLSNFAWHNNWTFRHLSRKDTSLTTKLLAFHASSWSGAAILVLLVSLGVTLTQLHYMVCLVFATAIVMFWNYYWSRSRIFSQHTLQ
ncbi:MAG: GtrA family protein [Candidatus Saccharibacteria bacterium]|nr:GtrA family protein [Candidatus Saccharibacteria bacterium]